MEGLLKLYKGASVGYKERYCVLDNNALTICKEKGGEIKGTLHMSAYTIKSDQDDFTLTLSNGLWAIDLKAETPELLESWVESLKQAKKDCLRRSLKDFSSKDTAKKKDTEGPTDDQDFKNLRKSFQTGEMKEVLTQLWAKQATLSQAVNDIILKVSKDDVYAESADLIETLGNDLRVSIQKIMKIKNFIESKKFTKIEKIEFF